MGKSLESVGEEFVEAEELYLLCAFAASGYLPEVVHLAFGGGLAEVFGVAEEGVVGLSEERREDAEREQKHQPGGGPCQGCREDQGGDDLLDQTAHLLDHRQPVGCLDAGPLEAVVEDGIFVGGQVEPGSLLHDADADVLGVAVGEERVRIVDGAGDQPEKDIEGDFGCDQNPEVGGKAVPRKTPAMSVMMYWATLAMRKGKNGDDDSQPEPPGHDRRSRLPEDSEDGRHIPKRSQPVAPWALSIHKVFQIAPKVRLQREREVT